MKIKIKKFWNKIIRGYSNEDWFKCQNCGHTVKMKVLGNTATCSQCGGRMVRI